MIGAIIGDIVGSRFEFHNRLSKEFDFFHPACRFTDDTVMTCAVAKALMACGGDYDNLEEIAVKTLREVGQPYPGCGYGGRFVAWMYSTQPRPYESFGNGSAMRISAVGDIARTIDDAKMLSYKVTAITHNHPEGLKGAESVAVAMVLAKNGMSKAELRDYIETNYYKNICRVDEYRRKSNGHGAETCQISVPQAFSCFFEGSSYEDVIRNCISIGGDSDTLGAMAGAVAEAYYGVPTEFREEAMKFLDERLRKIVTDFEQYILA